MSDTPAARILNDLEPIPVATLEFLQRTDSPTIANAIEELDLRKKTEGFLGGEIRSQFPELGSMVGRALTVKMTNDRGADDQRRNYWTMWETLRAATEPIVLVMADETGQPDRVAYAGEVMSRLAKRLGAVGMVTDGAFRDINEARDLGFHYFMKYPVVSHANFEVAAVGEPVVLDGQRVQTGDILHGDVNGVVIVPDAALGRIEQQVDAVRAREQRQFDIIASDDFTLERLRTSHSY